MNKPVSLNVREEAVAVMAAPLHNAPKQSLIDNTNYYASPDMQVLNTRITMACRKLQFQLVTLVADHSYQLDRLIKSHLPIRRGRK